MVIYKAMGYGLLAIAMSFGVGNLGTVLQACMALVGSMVGPLLALFCLGVFFSHATAPVCPLLSKGISKQLSTTVGIDDRLCFRSTY